MDLMGEGQEWYFSVNFQTVAVTSWYNYHGSSNNGTWPPQGYNIPPAATVGKHQVKNLHSFPPKTLWVSTWWNPSQLMLIYRAVRGNLQNFSWGEFCFNKHSLEKFLIYSQKVRLQLTLSDRRLLEFTMNVCLCFITIRSIIPVFPHSLIL